MPTRTKFSFASLFIWGSFTIVSYLLAGRIFWDLSTPRGFWRIPSIRQVHADQVVEPSSKIDFSARVAGPGLPNRWLRIPLEEAEQIRPDHPVLFMDCYYLADNQPNMHRVTSWRLIEGYPELWFAVLLLVIRRRRRKTVPSSPEAEISLAFYAYRKWGPIRKKPPIDRIRKEIPKASQEQVDAWLLEFKKIEKLMWNLAEQGGSFKLGYDAVTKALTDPFPFLSGKGLQAAVHDLNWDAWHEGLDK